MTPPLPDDSTSDTDEFREQSDPAADPLARVREESNCESSESQSEEESAEKEQPLDWEHAAAPGRTDVHRENARKLDRRAMAVALIASASIHAVALGAIYLVFHRAISAAHLSFAKSERAVEGSSSQSEHDASAGSAAKSRMPALLPHPTDLKADPSSAAAMDPAISEDSAFGKTLALSASDAFQSDHGEQANATALDALALHSIVLPKFNTKADNSLVSTSAAPSTQPSTPQATPQAAVAAAKIGSDATSRPPRVAGAHNSADGSHKARNGYDDRGLPIPDYPAESRRHREQGLVVLDVEVKADGSPGEIRVVKDPGYPLLTAAATDAVRETAFEPAQQNGVPVPGHIRIPFRFVLEQ